MYTYTDEEIRDIADRSVVILESLKDFYSIYVQEHYVSIKLENGVYILCNNAQAAIEYFNNSRTEKQQKICDLTKCGMTQDEIKDLIFNFIKDSQ